MICYSCAQKVTLLKCFKWNVGADINKYPLQKVSGFCIVPSEYSVTYLVIKTQGLD